MTRTLCAVLLTFLSSFASAANFTVGKGEVHVRGAISAGDNQIFDQIVDTRSDTRPVNSVVLDSGGGDVTVALAIARKTAALGLDTEVSSHGICASACFLIFAAGRQKTYRSSSYVGVHEARTANLTVSIGGTLQELAWLAQRGVPIPILEKLEANRTTVTTRLTESEMRSMGALVIDDSVSAPAEPRIIQPGEDFNRAPQRRYTPPVQFLKN